MTFECTLRDGLKFSDGSDLTAEDVVFSYERNVEIADPNGASSLLANMKSIEAPDDKTVVFNLNQPDTTFLKLLSTATTSIVDEESFPADELAADDAVIGSGPYALESFKKGEQAVLVANEAYDGERAGAAPQIFVTYFSDPAALRTAGVVLAVLALVAVLYHTVTWFSLLPKVAVIWRGEEKIPGSALIAANWAAWAVVSVVIAGLALYTAGG